MFITPQPGADLGSRLVRRSRDFLNVHSQKFASAPCSLSISIRVRYEAELDGRWRGVLLVGADVARLCFDESYQG